MCKRVEHKFSERCHLVADDFLEEFRFGAEIVVEHGMCHSCRLCYRRGARTGKALLEKLPFGCHKYFLLGSQLLFRMSVAVNVLNIIGFRLHIESFLNANTMV